MNLYLQDIQGKVEEIKSQNPSQSLSINSLVKLEVGGEI